MATPTTQQKDRLLRLRQFAHWMDAGIRIPGTSVRFGLDPVLGLIPGLGDATGAALGSWVLWEAAQIGVSRATLLRMTYNVGIDALIGAVPLLGDLFDFASKANLRNVELLEKHATDAKRAGRADRLFAAVLISIVAVACLSLAIASTLLVRMVLGWIG